MIVLISPAKSLDMQAAYPEITLSEPSFLEASNRLIKQLRLLNSDEVQALMGISEKLAALNVQRFQEWHIDHKTESCPAIFAFQGDVYQGLDAASLNKKSLDFAQQHLRILSGLYGILRPFDVMQAYRLEMGTKLATEDAKNLYEFWGERLHLSLQKELDKLAAPNLINLASQEYFKAVHAQELSARIITPVFKDYKNGEYKVISFYAKKARGMMVRYILEQQITQVEQLKQFNVSGYHFSAEVSDEVNWVFLRQVD